MTTTRPSQEDINDALQRAYDDIKSKKEYFICYALPDGTVGDYLREFVMASLRSQKMLKELGVHPLSLDLFVKYERNNRIKPTTIEMREYRLAWLQYMMS